MPLLFSSNRSLAGARGTRPANVRRPTLEVLEDRTVPATVNLTTLGAKDSIGAAVFQQTVNDAGGNGVLEPFVRLSSNPKTGLAQGYNTDARPLQFDEYKSKTFTHALKLSDVPTVTVNGVTYCEFVLDITQRNNSPLVSLDEFRLYAGGAPNLKGYDPVSKKLAGLTPVYDLDGTGDNTVILNGSLQAGSGWGDARVLVPTDLLTSSGNSYLYLYSKFGATLSAEGGYEAWAIREGSGTVTPPVTPPPVTPPPVTPPPVTPPPPASLSGYVFLNGFGMGGVILTLSDADGNVVATATTASDGSYSFTDLAAGTYRITEAQPIGWEEAGEHVGSLGEIGPHVTNAFTVNLAAGDAGIEYNFFETGAPNT
jgi:hypothetical protein